GKRLLSIHNIHFLFELVENARSAIENDSFIEYKNQVYSQYGVDENDEKSF
ncbi:MAG: tRNA guanosine(34) transglycosylase Tgt, partial [Bacilli bacterium]